MIVSFLLVSGDLVRSVPDSIAYARGINAEHRILRDLEF